MRHADVIPSSASPVSGLIVKTNRHAYNGEDFGGTSMKQASNVKKTKTMPLLPLRGIVVFPYMILHFDVGRAKSVKALEDAMLKEQTIFLAAQKDPGEEEPGREDIHPYGTIARIKQLLRLPGDTIRVLVEGLERARVLSWVEDDPYYTVIVEEIRQPRVVRNKSELEALARQVVEHFERYAKLTNRISPDASLSVSAIDDFSRLPDVVASNMNTSVDMKQAILAEASPKRRLEKLLDILVKEIEILEIERNINSKVRQQIDKSQREYYLREQMKAIQKELGDNDTGDEGDEYRGRILEAKLPEDVEKKALKELDRLQKMHTSSAESGVIRTYLDWLLDLPWNISTQENLDLANASLILDRDHYGLEKVKERMVEYLAVRKLRHGLHGPIICLAGPPGVGKTSIAKSIAESLNRKYVRMSLGGVRDEAEIRGHRRTYVGAMPGRIISAIKQAGSRNPLILLDEIDKMSSDFRGDPASAMLEVLDAEQNKDFRDHYLEVPFDLSDVLFVTTANYKDAIPRPLLDRMEVIDISGYTDEEKIHIASRHLIPKQLELHGIPEGRLKFETTAIREIIRHYTREAGVRNLERSIATILRKCARKIVENDSVVLRLAGKTIEPYLGPRRFLVDKKNETDEVGVARGLAWTPVGGDTLSIEVSLVPGEGMVELTGQLGDVMKESARIARSVVRSRADELGIDPLFHKKTDMHLHVPEGAIPKDGPSAGITLATAMVSALTGIPVLRNVAMTGEITLRGRVLAIGGLKEKALAAYRAGVDTIIIPMENRKDVQDIPEKVREKLRILPVSRIDQVLRHALVRMPVPSHNRRKTDKPGGEKLETKGMHPQTVLPQLEGTEPHTEH